MKLRLIDTFLRCRWDQMQMIAAHWLKERLSRLGKATRIHSFSNVIF